MTDPGSANDADRAEQDALIDPPPVVLTGDAVPPGDDVPEADGLEQQLDAGPGDAPGPLQPVGDREADAADVLEQETDVPDAGDDELPG